jgi:methylated-DNA-[protein]-cysteine S-methyltransferase
LTALPPAYLQRSHFPIGRVEIGSDGEVITSLSIENAGTLPHDNVGEITASVLACAVEQLTEYFFDGRCEFDLPIHGGGTEFQRAVWSSLTKIPWGEHRSYGDIGTMTGRVSAGRAVGRAVGANPLPLLVPCHRVLASDQRITGYSAGSGVPTKIWLLEHEGISYKV